MLINEHWGVEDAPVLALFSAYQKNAFPVIIVNFCDLWEHALNYSQYVLLVTNKDFKFDLDRKLNPWLKFEPKLISWHGYQTANRKDHSLSAIFLIYSIQ